MDKCICHINEYQIKDSVARSSIEEFKNSLNNIAKEYEYIELPFSKFSVTGTYNLKVMTNLSSADSDLCSELTLIIQKMFMGEDGTYSRTNYINRKPLLIYFRNDKASSSTFLAEEVSLYHLSTENNNTGYLDFESNYTFTTSGKQIANRGFRVYVDTSFNVTKIEFLLNKLNLLTTDNTTSYTPTASYHPATKKYVDDAIANVESSGGTGGVSEDTVNTLIENAISEEVANRDNAISTAISGLETGLSETQVNSLITSAINTEVTNRNNAINNAITEVNTDIQKHIIRADLQSAVTLSSTSIVTLSLSETIKVGNKFSVSDGKVVIGSGVNHVMVSGNVYFEDNIKIGDSLRAHIFKNEERVAKNWERYSEADNNENTGGYEDRGIIPTLISVQEGDVISLRGNNSTASTGKINTPSYLIVEYVD